MSLKTISVKTIIIISVLLMTNLFLVYLWQNNSLDLSSFLILSAFGFVMIILNLQENFKSLEKTKTKLLEEANSQFNDGKMIVAESSYRKVVELDRNNHEALAGIGKALKARAQWKKACEYFSKASQIKPTAEISFNTGVCYFKEGDYKNAISEFKNSLELDKKVAEAYLYLGDIHFMLGEDFEAKKYYVKYLLSAPVEENTAKPIRKKLDTVIERMRQRTDNNMVKV
jgi:tetratricopeptide (TPR) repeat protein